MNPARQFRRFGSPPAGASLFHINVLDVADLAIVFWQGTITSKDHINALRRAITARLSKPNVVLDFSEVETISPEALAELVTLWRTAERQATRLAIFNPSLASCLELRKIRSRCQIAILTDAEFLGLLRQAKALKARPSAEAARHWGQRLSHALRCAGPP